MDASQNTYAREIAQNWSTEHRIMEKLQHSHDAKNHSLENGASGLQLCYILLLLLHCCRDVYQLCLSLQPCALQISCVFEGGLNLLGEVLDRSFQWT